MFDILIFQHVFFGFDLCLKLAYFLAELLSQLSRRRDLALQYFTGGAHSLLAFVIRLQLLLLLRLKFAAELVVVVLD